MLRHPYVVLFLATLLLTLAGKPFLRIVVCVFGLRAAVGFRTTAGVVKKHKRRRLPVRLFQRRPKPGRDAPKANSGGNINFVETKAAAAVVVAAEAAVVDVAAAAVAVAVYHVQDMQQQQR